MKKNKLISIVIIIVIVISAFSIYYVKTKPIYVAFSAGLSGQWSQLGVQVRNGFIQGVDDINSNGGVNGHKIIPIIFDDKNDNEYAKTLLNTLNEQNIDYLIGFTLSSMTPATEHFLSESNILIFSPTMSTNLLSGLDDNFFRICNPSSHEAYSLLDVLKKDGLKDFAIVYDTSNWQYTKPLYDTIVNSKTKYDLNLVYEEAFDSHNIDFNELSNRLINSKAKQIVILSSGVDTAQIAQRLQLNNNTAILYASAWATTKDLISNGGTAVENMRLNGLYDFNSTNPKSIAFENKMIAKYGNKPSFPQLFGYETISILAKSMESSKSLDVISVKKSILKTSSFEGLQENIAFDEFGDPFRPYFIYTVKNGEFISFD